MKRKNNIRRIKLSENKGALLVEIMLTVALFSILSLAIASMLLISGVIFRTNDAHARLNDGAMKIFHYIGREIKETSTANTRLVFNGANCAGTVCFQIPVDFDDDEDATANPTDSPSEWGAYDHAGETKIEDVLSNPLNRWVQYSVNANNQLVRDVLVGPASNSATDPALTTIVANNVQGFNVALNIDSVTITVNLRATDTIGQSGTARNLDTSFTYNVLLRNAAN